MHGGWEMGHGKATGTRSDSPKPMEGWGWFGWFLGGTGDRIDKISISESIGLLNCVCAPPNFPQVKKVTSLKLVGGNVLGATIGFGWRVPWHGSVSFTLPATWTT